MVVSSTARAGGACAPDSDSTLAGRFEGRGGPTRCDCDSPDAAATRRARARRYGVRLRSQRNVSRKKEHEQDEVDSEERGQHPHGGASAERLRERAAEERAEREAEQWGGIEDAYHLSALGGVVDVREGSCADSYEGARTVRIVAVV